MDASFVALPACPCVIFIFVLFFGSPMGSPMAQMVKNSSARWETWVQSLGWEDPLENGRATHSSILAWRIPWTVLICGVAKSWT